MNDLFTQLMIEHRHCDDLFLQVENMVGKGEWDHALAAFLAFSAAFRRHVATEEERCFPLLRKASGEDAWPVKVLGAEHAQLEMILCRMEQAVQARNKADFMLHAESFLILMHTHSIKEEEIIYPGLERAGVSQAN